MIRSNKGDMWALNALVAVGLIAIFLFGFFITASLVLPKDVGKVKAAVADVDSGSRIIGFFRVPVGDLIIADIVRGAVSCSEFEDVLGQVYDYSGYSLKIGGKEFCSKGSVKAGASRVDFVLPVYDGRVVNVLLEVAE